MTEWPAPVEDALAFYFARERGHGVTSVVIFDYVDDGERAVASWNYAARAPDSPSTIDLTADVDWIMSADAIGNWEVHVPSLFDALDLHRGDLGECQRSTCKERAERFVLFSAVFADEAHTTPDEAIQEVCERHEPSACPFHAATEGGMSSPPGFGWKPGKG